MTPDQFAIIQETIKDQIAITTAEAIEKNVNGKIRNMDKKFDDYIVLDKEWKKEDMEWKKTAQPIVDFSKKADGFGTIMKWLAKGAITMLAIGGGLKLLKDFFTLR